MANRSKAKGSAFEKDIQDYLRDELLYDVERLRTTGAEDEGDLVVKEGSLLTIIEAKATANLNSADFIRQAFLERDHYARNRSLDPGNILPLVVWKRRQKPVSEALVITTLQEFFR